jgi:hypothetical protein
MVLRIKISEVPAIVSRLISVEECSILLVLFTREEKQQGSILIWGPPGARVATSTSCSRVVIAGVGVFLN